MAQINKPSDYFNTKLYTGNGSTGHAITGVGFQPDWLWIKSRDSATDNHNLFDVVRGASVGIQSNSTNAEYTASSVHESFDTDGFTLGNNGQVNGSSENFVSWNWLAGGAGSSNTDGTITSTVSANTTSGFSIVSYTGTGSNATVGHGLGVAPKMIIIKNRDDGTKNWVVGHQSIGFTKYLVLNNTDGESTQSAIFQDTNPTSTVFSLGTNTAVNQSTASTIAYCFAEKKGYSKFGSYTGNGNADGTFVYTGFKPACIIIKQTNGTNNWRISDNKRLGYNEKNYALYPSDSVAEGTEIVADFLSNGFKLRGTGAGTNGSGSTYIYMAFAEAPVVGTNNVPATAR